LSRRIHDYSEVTGGAPHWEYPELPLRQWHFVRLALAVHREDVSQDLIRSYASSKGSHTLACGVGGPMKLAALILAACLVTACTSGPGDAASPSATLVVPAPGEPLTMACARFGSAPVTDLAGIIGSADPKLRNRGLANISDTVADIASEVERAIDDTPPQQIGALRALRDALTDFMTALTSYREVDGDPYGPALEPVIEAMASVQAACAAGSFPSNAADQAMLSIHQSWNPNGT